MMQFWQYFIVAVKYFTRCFRFLLLRQPSPQSGAGWCEKNRMIRWATGPAGASASSSASLGTPDSLATPETSLSLIGIDLARRQQGRHTAARLTDKAISVTRLRPRIPRASKPVGLESRWNCRAILGSIGRAAIGPSPTPREEASKFKNAKLS
jgi:hypothetical protein